MATNKYVRAVSINYLSFIFNTLFFLVITSIAIRVMGEEIFGLWSILNAILLFSSIGTLGIGVVVNKFSSETDTNAIDHDLIFMASFIIILPMAFALALMLFFSRHWIAFQLEIGEDLRKQLSQAIIFTALSIFPQFLARVPQGYLLSQLKNKTVRTIELALNISLWAGVVLIAFLTKNLVWMALWGLLVNISGLIILLRLTKSLINLKLKVNFSIIKKLFNFSLFSFIETIAIALFQQFDRILIGFTLGPIAAGAYAVGTSIGLRLPLISGQATEVMISYASHKNTLENRTSIFPTYRNLTQLNSLLTGLISALLIFWMDFFLTIWISADYAEKYSNLFRLLILAYFYISISRSGHQTLTGMGKIKFTSLIYLASSILMLCSVYLLTIKFGLIGSALANLTMISLLTLNLIVYKFFNKHQCWMEMISDLGPACVLTGFAYMLVFTPFFLNLPFRFLLTLLTITFSFIFALKNNWIKLWLTKWTNANLNYT